MSRRGKWILGVESSCDDTALALVDECGAVHADLRYSQIAMHNKFGGVVPELASRSHFDRLEELFVELEKTPGFEKDALFKIAATCGPGLIGPLLVGASFGKGLARGWELPFEGVHHLRGHLASLLLNRENKALREQMKELCPCSILLVSGGHTQILLLEEGLETKVLANTSDDAAGECFDKSAKLMGLPYPGGPSIESMAQKCDEKDLSLAKELSAKLPRPKSQQGFSFSGLKTAIRLMMEANPSLRESPAMAWAVQDAIGATLEGTLRRKFLELETPPQRLAFCGGVSANLSIRKRLEKYCKENSIELLLPEIKFSTDNAAMIAAACWVQDSKFRLNTVSSRPKLS